MLITLKRLLSWFIGKDESRAELAKREEKIESDSLKEQDTILKSGELLAECGHLTRTVDRVEASGDFRLTQLPVNDSRTPYCHRCLEKMVIRCAWCGKSIFIGDPVTLYSPVKDDFKVPDYAVYYNKEKRQLVGCLRWNCADTGADRMGFWHPPGKVERVLSPIEMCLAKGTAISMDVSDPAKAVKV